MKMCNDKLILAMCDYEAGCPHRIQHLIKVYTFSQLIGREENLPETVQHVLETAAIVHDIGIKPSEAKYGSGAGHYQELEGPAEAEKLLGSMGYSEEVIERVSYLVGHHHTYTNMDGMDYQILVEADFLVNIHEGKMGLEEIKSVREKIFRTKTGTALLEKMFL